MTGQGVPSDKSAEATEQIAALSRYIDASYSPGMDAELVIRRRVDKVGVEFGEVGEAVEAWTGENPRKGVFGTVDEVIRELLRSDVPWLVEGLKQARRENGELRAERNIAVNAAASKIPNFDVVALRIATEQREAADKRAVAAERSAAEYARACTDAEIAAGAAETKLDAALAQVEAVRALRDKWAEANGMCWLSMAARTLSRALDAGDGQP